MAFIVNDFDVINIKLTNKGREKLSKGQLTFSQYAVGDSEINYSFNKAINFSAFNADILRPKDAQPELKSHLIRDELDSGTTRYDLPPITSIPSTITNTAKKRGFFNDSGTALLSDQQFVKQPDAAIAISGVTGGTKVTLKKSPTYLGNITEPQLLDYILVKWTNPVLNSGTTNFDVDIPIPYLWYKIENIVSGTLANNDLVIDVDKPLPNFNGMGGDIEAQALIYPRNSGYTTAGDAIQNYYGSPFVTDFLSEAVFSFRENYDTPTIDVPVWNMSIVFTDEVIGVNSGGTTPDFNLSQYNTKTYGGFVRYIEELDESIKNIGIIHYSNQSPSNNYGEGLVDSTPKLTLPTILWHKNSSGETGIVLSADTTQKFLPDLNVEYHDLIDKNGDIFGKVFLGLKIFIIEDQELLYAMSYKSNRNWTLPPTNADFNITFCPPCNLTITSASTSPSTIGGSDGSVTAILLSSPQGTVTYSIDGGNTRQISNTFNGLSADTYTIIAYDSGSPDCEESVDIVVNDPISNIIITLTAPSSVDITDSNYVMPASTASFSVKATGVNNAPYDFELISGGSTVIETVSGVAYNADADFNSGSYAPGTYTIKVTDSINGTETSGTLTFPT